ncbi:MAG: YfhO family protein, partial [Oscillospiraceae bacterium]
MNKIKNNYIRVFIFALITATIIFIPFLIYDNGLFLYYGDFDVQQIPFYELAHKAVREGNMGFSFITDLGSNFIGSYSFYLLGSPFFWLTIPFPTSVVPYLMAPLLILKFSLSAVTSYAFISRFTKSKDTAIIGCLIYAFCGFNIYNIFFNHFNEVVVLFPLMLVALEELINNDRYGVFALTVCASALMNYYFFFGQVIFIIIYFIIRCFDKNFNVTIKKFFILALEAIIGLLMSSILLLPSIMTIISNTRLSDNLWGFDMICYNNVQRYGLILESMFFPPDIPARPNFFPDSNSKWSSVSLFLPLFSMAGVFAFFKGVKKHWAKTLLSICVLLALVPILNASFSAFNYSYYARWFYMPLLIMAMVTCIALENHEEHFPFGIKLNLAIVGAFSLIGVLPKKEDGKLIFFSLPPHPERFWAYVIIDL